MYRYFNSKFWSDPFIESLSPLHKLVYIFLFTFCPNQCGIFEISEKRISFETNIEEEEVKKALTILEENKKIYRIGSFVILANFLKYQANRSPKVIKKIEKELKEIQDKSEIIEIYKEKVWSVHMEKARGVPFPLSLKDNHQEEKKELENASLEEVTESAPLVAAQKVSEEVEEKETDTQDSKEEETKQPEKKHYTKEFEAWWEAYPRKVGKKAAFRAWKKAKKEGMPPLEVLLKKLEKQKQSEQWQKEGGQYIPHPSTYLNQGRWEDVLEDEEVSTAKPEKKEEEIPDKEKDAYRKLIFQYNVHLNEMRKKHPDKNFAELAKKMPLQKFFEDVIDRWKREGKIIPNASYQRFQRVSQSL